MKLTNSIFFKLIALIYLIAFSSLFVQIKGLIGSQGILPASNYLHSISLQTGIERYWLVPSLFWLCSNDKCLILLCILGIVLSIIAFFEISQVLIFFLLWLFYLSFVSVSQEFLSFQWDNLLLETGFLSIFLVANLRSKLIIFLLRLLLFKLMFLSGLVKLLSSDVTWRNLTALTYHYETQPLPNIISYYIYWLPNWFHKISCIIMFINELVFPFLLFGTRNFRIFSCLNLMIFQIIIIATGNYCFFNLLTIALCVLLLDDEFLNQIMPKVETHSHASLQQKPTTFSQWLIIFISSIIIIITTMQFSRVLGIPINWPMPFKIVYSMIYPFRSINTYGLFAIMTTSRPEIVIEGSNDGINWQAYEFKYKPGDMKRSPSFVAPHQPRLDWQMWFCALGSYRENPWFINLCIRLLQGSKDVIKLLKYNPFPESPPKYIRALLYDYHFTSYEEKKNTNDWWKRELKGFYFPPVTQENGKLILKNP